MTNLTPKRHLVPATEHAGGPTTQPEPIDHQDEATEHAATEACENAGSGSTTPTPEGDPTCLGRYRIIRRLGQGGFGRVHLAQDDELDRPVAIKVPLPERILGPDDMERFVAEARALARLDHHNIVPVYDVGHTDDGRCFVVFRYVEGTDLSEWLKRVRPSFRESAELTAVVAEALHHAHTRDLVHRDIKPANILINSQGQPCVADFGPALKEQDFDPEARIAGTPAYMSPEQARGEGHRVDGRSDIFSLGVVLYELLTGRRPFQGESHAQVLKQIINSEPRPPRQIDDTIPRELERICQKALAKRASERYSTGRDMADDLRHFLQTEPTSGAPATAPGTIDPSPGITEETTPLPPARRRTESGGWAVKVIPKGLRPFDEHDTDFFLELVPGPRDRDELPESIRFWKTRIEENDPDKTFPIGLIYGPSGCGKSSLVRAGLLPCLAKHVLSIYVEATPDTTETRLLKALRKACPDLPACLGLVEPLAAVRRGRGPRPGQKVLLVLDQFEQWLLAKQGAGNTELVAALRHCDGERVQALVLVRDDFWMAATRFMGELEVPLIEGQNSAAVDRFDLLHARRVLTAFGRAYGVLPERTSDLTPEQQAFLDQSVAGLAQDGKVIPVRAALFAEMVKGRRWTPATLRDVGGTDGVGLNFLEETFSAASASPEHRLHQKAAQAVLKALLPQTGTDIKGQTRSETELLEASGYSGHPRNFDDLVRILDRELRLITPTDPEGSTVEAQSVSPECRRYYQLTHDYLVHSLREWLTRKQRETRRGRAELRLAELAALWVAKPENRHLPTAFEWADIRTLTRPEAWTDPQRRMMRRAGQVHGLRALGLSAVAAVLAAVGLDLRRRVIETNQATAASGLVQQLLKVDTPQVPGVAQALQAYRCWADPELRRTIADSSASPKEQLHASLALLPHDGGQIPYLESRLLDAKPGELPVLRDALRPHHSRLTARLWSIFKATQPGDPRLLRSAAALALYDPEDSRWADLGGKVAEALVTENSMALGPWLEALRPVGGKLTAPLAEIFRDRQRSEDIHSRATDFLADYARDDPRLLAQLLMDSDPKAYRTLFPVVQRRADQTLGVFRAEIAPALSALEPGMDAEPVKDQRAQRQARAAITLIRLGHTENVWPLLRHRVDPQLRSLLVNWLRPLGVEPKTIAEALGRIDLQPQPIPASGESAMDAILFEPKTSIRRALILALGRYSQDELSSADRQILIDKLIGLYCDDPDAGIHGAAESTLRQWSLQTKLKKLDATLRGQALGIRRWYVNRRGQTFAIVYGPVEFGMGSHPNEPDRFSNETPHRRLIPRCFAIATKEVTVEQYQEFTRDDPRFVVPGSDLNKYSPAPDGPMIGVSWYGAAAYCNWLSKQEGLPEDQWCYEPNEQGEYAEGMRIKAGALQLKGYRLPTGAEWEYSCRAGAVTSRYFGSSSELLPKYAWYQSNSPARARPCGSLLPNDLGLFDMLGNMYEWCQDREVAYQPGTFIDVVTKSERVNEDHRLLRGGTFTLLAAYVRSAFRFWSTPTNRYLACTGLRPVRTCP